MKYHIIICAILKDETPYLVEWAEHHLGIGVEHFVLYDNNSVIPAKQTLEAYVRKGVVEVTDCPITNTPTGKSLFSLPFQYARPGRLDRIHRYRRVYRAEKAPGTPRFSGQLATNMRSLSDWVIHTANGHIEKPEGPVMQNYTEPLPYDFPANRHVKSIVQPAGVGIVVSPHYALYSDDYYAVDEKHRHVPGAFSEFSNEIAQINHYQTKSFEEWLDKVKRGIADSNFNRRKVEDFWPFQSPDAAFKTASRAAVSR